MYSNKLFFCVPRVIVQVKAIVQPIWQNIEIPDGPHVVLMCETSEQMVIINEKILRGREVETLVNIDINTQPSSFGVFLQVRDNDGIDLSSHEIQSLLMMTDLSYQVVLSSVGTKTSQVMFGNVVDINDEEMTLLIEGKQKYGKFNFIIGYSLDEGHAVLSAPGWTEPVIIKYCGNYTTEKFEDYLEKCFNIFRK